MEAINIKKETLKVALGLAYVIGIIVVIRKFHLSTWSVILLLCCTSLIFSILRYRKNIISKKAGKEIIKIWLTIVVIVWFFKWLAQFGIWGYILSLILIPVLIIWRKWSRFLFVKQYIESRLWGKPLKEYREAGEKPPKLVLSK